MFERFTERARQVVALAQEEARTLKHGQVGTEHLLLGLLREPEGVAYRVLHSFDITLERARGEVVRIVGIGQHATSGQMPFSSEARGVLEQAAHEPRNLGHNYIGTEHLLLALVSVGEGVPKRILLDCGVEPDQIRNAVMTTLSGAGPRPQATAPEAPPAADNGFEQWIRVGPGARLRRLLMVAAARALDAGREEIQPRDVLLALTRDEQAGPLLADLGVDDGAILRAIERRRGEP